MARRSKIADPEAIRQKLIELLQRLPTQLERGTTGEQVCSLVEVSLYLRQLGAAIGASLAPDRAGSGRARLLAYLRNQVGRIVHTEELMIVAGIGDYPRRIRELRTDHGWPIISGMAARDMRAEDLAQAVGAGLDLGDMAPEEYVLIEDQRDPDAIRRWALANSIRDSNAEPQTALRAYFDASPHRRVTAEELRHVSGNNGDWPAMVRGLLGKGYPIQSRAFGLPDIPVGIYIYCP